MGKNLRVILLISVLVGTLGLAQSQAAWAGPAAADVQSAQEDNVSPSSQWSDDHTGKGGTVKPPPDKSKICKAGNFSLGGVSVVRVHRLAPDYCLSASLRKAGKDASSVPGGRILANITEIQFFYQGQRIGTLPESGGNVEICYAIPPGRQAQIYFRGFGAQDWQPLSTTYTKRTACAPAQVSGSYALIGQ